MNEKEIFEFCFPNSIRKIVKYLYIIFIALDLIISMSFEITNLLIEMKKLFLL